MSGNYMKIEGVDKLLKTLANLGSKSMGARVQRKAERAGLKPIKATAKALAPREHGDVAKAITSKIWTKDFTASGIVGVDINYVADDGERPGKIDHLLEYGHVEDGKVTPPHPFIRPAGEQSRGAALRAYAEKMASEIENEASK
jgi:HK97 gp10 family phage protein